MVKIGDSFSSNYTVKSGVPQGSVLGPILFNFYMHDILSNLSFPGITIKSFADDTKAYISFKPNDVSHCLNLQLFIDYFFNCCNDNGLSIAILKCQILHVGRNNLKFDYKLQGEIIPKVSDSIRDLGIYVSPDLKWKSHIHKICRSANTKFFQHFKSF